MSAHLLVVAKAPEPGRSKTRLGASVGPVAAAELAAEALLDTLAAGAEAFDVAHRHVALTGSLDDAVHADRVRAALEGWTIHQQRGDTFGERLAHAHADVPGPVVQIGMDTPQVTPADLLQVVDGLSAADAVLGPAEDGGWWVLGLRDPAEARHLVSVPMSRDDTGDLTRRALESAGLTVATACTLLDVDVLADADAVAAAAPTTGFAQQWHRIRRVTA